jgi:class 3 adenylate cyclase
MALEMRDEVAKLSVKWSHSWHDIGFGVGIAHGYATLGSIGYEGPFQYSVTGKVANLASRLCDQAKNKFWSTLICSAPSNQWRTLNLRANLSLQASADL